MIRRIDYEETYSEDILRIEAYTPSYLSEPVTDRESDSVQWLREGLVCHIDLMTFETIPPETWREKKKYSYMIKAKIDEIVQAYRDTYTDIVVTGGNVYEHWGHIKWNKHPKNKDKKRIDPFIRFRKIEYGNVVISIKHDRHYRYGGRWKADGEISIGWKRKEDYSGYSEHVMELERVLNLVGLRVKLYRAEVAMDTTSRDVWREVFKHTLVRGGNASEIMWFNPEIGKHGKVVSGVGIGAEDIYQNNWQNERQLLNHVKNKAGAYYDHVMDSHILRSELRIRRSEIERYGKPVVNTVLENMEKIYNDGVMWKQVKASKMRELRFNDAEKRLIAQSPVIYWVWRLTQLGISIGDARNHYCVSIGNKPCRSIM